MTWFDKSAAARPIRAVFSDRTAARASSPDWVEDHSPGGPMESGVFNVRPLRTMPHEPEPVASAPPPPPVTEVRRSIAAPPAPPQPDTQAAVAKTEAMLARLEQSIAQIAGMRAQLIQETERQMVALAAKIARKVVARELETDSRLVLTLAAEGIQALEDRDRVVVRVGSPVDDQHIASFLERIRSHVQKCEIVYDPRLGPGGCVVETDLGMVDESIDTRFDNVMRALADPNDGASR